MDASANDVALTQRRSPVQISPFLFLREKEKRLAEKKKNGRLPLGNLLKPIA